MNAVKLGMWAYMAVVAWAFVILYSVRAVRLPGQSWRLPWWKSGVGMNLWLFTATIALIASLAVVSAIAGPLPGAVWVALLGLMSLLLTHRLALRIRDMQAERDERIDRL